MDELAWDAHIDEASLNQIDRLGLAYCRLNTWKWDDVLGPKPEGFDELPDYDKEDEASACQEVKTKMDYLRRPLQAIEEIIGWVNTSRCWWKFVLGKTDEEWFRWFVSPEYLSVK